MLKTKFKKSACGLLLCALAWVAHAADAYPVLFGKDGWLFTPYEFATPTDAGDTQATIDLLVKTNKLFERKGIAMALVIVPSKVRINGPQLPDDRPLDAYTDGKYDSAVQKLRSGGVNVVNLNQAFMSSANRVGDNPIYLKQDTHWSPTGAMLAAETIKATIEAVPALKTAWAATVPVEYTLAWAKGPSLWRARDLVHYLPKEQQTFAPERALAFKVTRTKPSSASLQGAGDPVGILVIGSSYSNPNTLYADAIRYQLQRDVLNISIPVDQGPWVGLEGYLGNDAYKTNPPKLVIWEIPERELRSPPNAKFRDVRYQSDNNAWLQRVTGLLQ